MARGGMRRAARLCALWYACALLCACGAARAEADADISLGSLLNGPHVTLTSPVSGESWGADGTLRVEAAGRGVVRFEATLTMGGETWEASGDGDAFSHVFTLDQPTGSATLVVTGFGADGAASPAREGTARVASPKEELIERMIALAYANSKDKKYRFAPAEEDYHIGVCKNFVMRLFDTFSKEYRMAEYPALALHMPKNNSKVNCNAQGYDYGIEWRPETAADGTPFEIAASFRYDPQLSKQENAQKARAMLESVQKGDFFQMVGNYGGGNGPHSLFFIADYDPETDKLHWTDSNMKGKRIDGVRWGYMQFDADATAEWFVSCINTRKRGATLYRLRDDLYKQP